MSESLERLKAALADRYAHERELGAGGMATVYLAQDLRHDRKVAVKVLRPDIVATAVGTERFLQEVRVTANLQQPHLLNAVRKIWQSYKTGIFRDVYSGPDRDPAGSAADRLCWERSSRTTGVVCPR